MNLIFTVLLFLCWGLFGGQKIPLFHIQTHLFQTDPLGRKDTGHPDQKPPNSTGPTYFYSLSL